MMELLYVISDQYAGVWSYFVFCQKKGFQNGSFDVTLCNLRSIQNFCFIFFLHFLLEGVSTEKCGGCDDNLMLIGH